jgi:hypothetical protein
MNTVRPIAVQDRKYVLSVGLDWADQKHALSQRGWADGQRPQFEIGADPASVEAWLAQLKALAGPEGRVAVGFEQNPGALFAMLRAHTDWIDLYPLNPLTVSKFREALFTSGAKDDPLDSQLIEELLYHHLDRLRPYQAPEPELRELDLLCQQRRKAVDAAVACANELCSLLKVYYPLPLDLHEELCCSLTLHFLKRWPTLEQLKKAKPQTLRSFYYQHHSRSQSLITERLEKIARAQAVTEDLALIRPSVLSLQRLVNQLLTLQASVAAFDKAIQALFAQHPDPLICESLPGAGPRLAPRLLGRLWLQSCCAESPQRNAEKERDRPRCWIAAVKPRPSLGAGVAASSSARLSTNLLLIPSRTPPGPRLVIRNSLLEVNLTMPLCAPWPLNGSASSSAFGRTAPLMTKATTLRPWKIDVPRLAKKSPNSKFFTCADQLSYCPTAIGRSRRRIPSSTRPFPVSPP